MCTLHSQPLHYRCELDTSALYGGRACHHSFSCLSAGGAGPPYLLADWVDLRRVFNAATLHKLSCGSREIENGEASKALCLKTKDPNVIRCDCCCRQSRNNMSSSYLTHMRYAATRLVAMHAQCQGMFCTCMHGLTVVCFAAEKTACSYWQATRGAFGYNSQNES